MSRVGNAPITIPSGVTVSLDGRSLTVKGSKGELSTEISSEVSVDISESAVNVAPLKKTVFGRSIW